MIALLKYRLESISKEQYLYLILFLAPIVGGSFAFTSSYVSNTNVILGFGLFFYVLQFEGKRRINYGYFGLMVFFVFIAYLYSIRMFYFLGLGFYILFLLESIKGKIGVLVLFLLLFMSPVFNHIALSFGFPIRLQLSQWAGSLLSIAGWDIRVEGNRMFLNGANFAVDEACMGLNMLAISMLMGVFLIAHFLRTSNKTLRFEIIAGFFLVAFGLNLVSNLLRIIILVVFEILPENPLHEILGIVCLMVYVVLPLWFLGKWLVLRFGKTNSRQETGQLRSVNWLYSFLPIAVLIIVVGIKIGQTKENATTSHVNVHDLNLDKTLLADGITKLEGKELLVYVKPIPEFFTGEHTPLICWKGSGYSFNGIKKWKVAGHEVYVGELVNKEEKLFTAWWYDNGNIKTIDQVDWRMRMLQGEKRFCLVNMTSNYKEVLLKNVGNILQTKTIYDPNKKMLE